MEITSLYGVYQAGYLDGIEPEGRRVRPAESGSRSKGDTVALSEEALVLAAQMRSDEMRPEESDTESGLPGEGNPNRQALASSDDRAGETVGSVGMDAKDLYAAIERVEKEVQQLSETLMLIMNGPGKIDMKVRQSEPVQKRLQERVQDLQSLKAQTRSLEDSQFVSEPKPLRDAQSMKSRARLAREVVV